MVTMTISTYFTIIICTAILSATATVFITHKFD